MKHFMVYRYLILRHPDQNERYLKLRTIYPHGQAEILFGVRIILANGNGCKKESENFLSRDWRGVGTHGARRAPWALGWGEGVGWGGGTRGERAMSKPQGDRLREAATARCLKTGGRTTVPGRRVAGVAVISIYIYIYIPYKFPINSLLIQLVK